MNTLEVLDKIAKYTRIQQCTFFLEGREYKYVCKVLDKVNIIVSNLSQYETNKNNLKIYKDKSSRNNIKESIEYNERMINKTLEDLEKLYQLYKEGRSID